MLELTEELDLITRILLGARFPLAVETRTQMEIAAAFDLRGIVYTREHVLSAGDRVDFFVSKRIAVEVKIKGSRFSIYRQCERYCQHPTVAALILASNVAMGLPFVIAGKPTRFVNLGRAWL